jgi:mannose-1-phosphate guanylyltransferase
MSPSLDIEPGPFEDSKTILYNAEMWIYNIMHLLKLMKNYNTDIYKFLNNQVLEKRQMFHAK